MKSVEYDTYVSLFVHHEEAIVVLGQEFKSSHDILGSTRNVCNLFWAVVIAQFRRCGGFHSDRHIGIGV